MQPALMIIILWELVLGWRWIGNVARGTRIAHDGDVHLVRRPSGLLSVTKI